MTARGVAAGAGPLAAAFGAVAVAVVPGFACVAGFCSCTACVCLAGGCNGLGTPTRYCQPKTTTIDRTMAISRLRWSDIKAPIVCYFVGGGTGSQPDPPPRKVNG